MMGPPPASRRMLTTYGPEAKTGLKLFRLTEIVTDAGTMLVRLRRARSVEKTLNGCKQQLRHRDKKNQQSTSIVAIIHYHRRRHNLSDW